MKQRSPSPALAAPLVRPAWQTYGFALFVLGVALLCRWLIAPWVGPHLPLATIYVGVTLVAWFGGWIPATLVAVTGYFLASWLFQAQAQNGAMVESIGIPRVMLYGISSGVTVFLFESIRRTERRHATSEARVSSILENMHECFCAVDAGWKITAVNRAAERYLGHSRDQLVGRTFWEIIPGAIGQPLEADLRRALEGRTSLRLETDALVPRAWHAVTAIPADDGLAIYCHDITATRAQVDELEHQVADRTSALK